MTGDWESPERDGAIERLVEAWILRVAQAGPFNVNEHDAREIARGMVNRLGTAIAQELVTRERADTLVRRLPCKPSGKAH